jgi:glutathione peroxidase
MDMKNILNTVLALGLLGVVTSAQAGGPAPKSVHDFTMKRIDGKQQKLSAYKGNVVLVVNVASKCGLTPQYEKLQTLYAKYKDKGLRIAAFPANNFGAQEPGTDTEISQFCTLNYKVSFDMFSKISVKGADIHPLYQYLTTLPKYKGDIAWNFGKFLVDKNGQVIARFEPATDPTAEDVVKAIEAALAAK